MKIFLGKIESISEKVFKQLSGLKEEDFQTALGIEFRKNKIDFMREAGLEVFYDNHPISLHELDFLIPPYCLAIEWPSHLGALPWAPTLSLELTIESVGKHRIRAVKRHSD